MTKLTNENEQLTTTSLATDENWNDQSINQSINYLEWPK